MLPGTMDEHTDRLAHADHRRDALCRPARRRRLRIVPNEWAQEGDVVALRWYSVVVDCQDPRKQARWWAEALGWTLIHDSETECIIIPSCVNEAAVRETPWERRGARDGVRTGSRGQVSRTKNRSQRADLRKRQSILLAYAAESDERHGRLAPGPPRMTAAQTR
jgi:hypothetical protein